MRNYYNMQSENNEVKLIPQIRQGMQNIDIGHEQSIGSPNRYMDIQNNGNQIKVSSPSSLQINDNININELSDSVSKLLNYWKTIASIKQNAHTICYDYYNKRDNGFGIIVIILSFASGFLSATSFSTTESVIKWMALSASIVSTISGLISAIERKFGFGKMATDHMKSAKAYEVIKQQIEMKLFTRNIITTRDQLYKTMNEFNKAIDTLIQNEPTIPLWAVEEIKIFETKEEIDSQIDVIITKLDELSKKVQQKNQNSKSVSASPSPQITAFARDLRRMNNISPITNDTNSPNPTQTGLTVITPKATLSIENLDPEQTVERQTITIQHLEVLDTNSEKKEENA